jgi:CYTH domain-containing protein
MTNDQAGVELEIEVSYLPTRLPQGLDQITPKRITDMYLSDDTDLLSKLRLRQKGDSYEMTKKVTPDPTHLSVQHEYNISLTEAEFTKLRSVHGREVIKDRYFMPLGNHTVEVDVFKGDLEGLILIEVEFSSEAQRDAFTPPEYFGADVTEENFVAGAYLAGKSYTDIQPELQRFGFQPLHVN